MPTTPPTPHDTNTPAVASFAAIHVPTPATPPAIAAAPLTVFSVGVAVGVASFGVASVGVAIGVTLRCVALRLRVVSVGVAIGVASVGVASLRVASVGVAFIGVAPVGVAPALLGKKTVAVVYMYNRCVLKYYM